MFGLSERQEQLLGGHLLTCVYAIASCKAQYPVVELPDYSLVYSVCKIANRWRVISDCNLAFDLSGYTFYPHLCDNRPEMAKAMAETLCFWLSLPGRKV